ncbi:terpene cyclase/mutase family protein [Aeoliella sp. ICT_H6.2]|uniref:Terpene cyclase/mutase family protein n=1 Tax=Aeoliella straminimaris TaxID=2954799 RepID=A0A9X2F8S8_9BACT|nr:prenyltransferase/squalene oxidase repeat-containing protein [Aeoliella straminimaris]MCO6043748.1 terpene cyclase/mutase family protein [Aeoliella straminimaris]
MKRRPAAYWLTTVAALLLIVPSSQAQEAVDGPKLNDVVQNGLTYLRDQGQDDSGMLSPRAGSGITSLAVTAALRHGCGLDDPLVARGLKALQGVVKPDGGIYASDRLRNYETCVGIMCFAEANKVAGDGRYDEIMKNAGKFVRGLQIGAEGEVNEDDVQFGGVGYSGKERPDLSNTSYLLEALHSLDAGADDPTVQRALVFVSRCQNLDSEFNDTEFAGKVNDGGFYYVIPTEAVDPSTSERYTANGGLRSYGSMTYSGFKSLVYAGLTKDDPRAKAALTWIAKNYDLEQNPGQGSAGLFYYYNTFGSALAATGNSLVTTADGDKHQWQEELLAQLASTQRDDGSWVNSNRQWFENDANLCTAFALMSLSYCDEPLQTDGKDAE